jgi:hypothetical protein
MISPGSTVTGTVPSGGDIYYSVACQASVPIAVIKLSDATGRAFVIE